MPISVPPLALAPSHVTSGLKPTEAPGDSGPAAAAQTFGSVLQQAMGNLQQVQSAADQSMVQLAVQVRNKLLDAYQEIMRMQM